MQSVAVALTTIIIVCYVDQFKRHISVCPLPPDMSDHHDLTADNTVQLAYSFWLLFAATCINVLIGFVLIVHDHYLEFDRLKRALKTRLGDMPFA
jgi:hypothetical protein